MFGDEPAGIRPQENGDHALMVPSPEPGDWFMFAFVNERPYQDYVQKVQREGQNLHIDINLLTTPSITVISIPYCDLLIGSAGSGHPS